MSVIATDYPARGTDDMSGLANESAITTRTKRAEGGQLRGRYHFVRRYRINREGCLWARGIRHTLAFESNIPVRKHPPSKTTHLLLGTGISYATLCPEM